MNEELKTLKDFDDVFDYEEPIEGYGGFVQYKSIKEELKQEAAKYYNKYMKMILSNERLDILTREWIKGQMGFIQEFFNLTDEDLNGNTQ